MKLRKTQLSYRLKKINGNVRKDGKIWNTGVALLKYFAGLNSNQNGQYGQIYAEKFTSACLICKVFYGKMKAQFKIRKFGVSDVIAITAAGKTAFYYVDKEALVKFNGFLAPKAEGSYLILNEGGYQIEGQTDTWKVIDEKNVQEQRFVQLVCEQTKKQKPDIVLHDSGVLVAQTVYGFDSSVMKKIEKFLREQKPELLHGLTLTASSRCWACENSFYI